MTTRIKSWSHSLALSIAIIGGAMSTGFHSALAHHDEDAKLNHHGLTSSHMNKHQKPAPTAQCGLAENKPKNHMKPHKAPADVKEPISKGNPNTESPKQTTALKKLCPPAKPVS